MSKSTVPLPVTPRRYVAVKRKASEAPESESKRLRFVASCDVRETRQVKEYLLTSSPTLMDVEFDVEDYDDFVLKEKAASFPKKVEGK